MDSTLWAVIIGGAIGLVGAALPGKYALRAAQVQADATTTQARIEHDRRDKEHRQGVYHSFANAVSRLTATATMAEVESFKGFSLIANPDAGGELRQQFLVLLTFVRDQMNGVLLFGTAAVREAAVPVDRLLRHAEAHVQLAALSGAAELVDETGFFDALSAWEKATSTVEWREAMRELTDAMRDEIVPT